MDNSRSPVQPLVIGISLVVGLILGLIVGLYYAWQVDPAFYAGGAYPGEFSEEYQKSYVEVVVDAYLGNGNIDLAATRLRDFSVSQKVQWLAAIASDYMTQGLVNEADGVGALASALQTRENWSASEVSEGLAAGNATQAFAARLGQVEQAPPQDQPSGGQPTAQASQPEAEGSGGGFGPLLWIILLLLVIAIGVILAMRLRTPTRTTARPAMVEMADDGSGLMQLRHWVGTYNFGQDNYDESFTVETAESDFLGECGMGIMEGFASGNPKRVLAFDVWLFDKTDIRTVSRPIMSQYAFNDDVFRNKLSPDADPVIAEEGATFDIETTALIVKAKIEEVNYGEGQPANSYFEDLKVSLTAYLKPDVDVSGTMPIPEGF
jgi:hypothetical protein